ncbi:transglycosylase domain-containing protein [Cognatishimia sp. MH4019]|uniref:transglycosylase domain-containing protein n=1 Tax=Cognatishimia sp. MH4019 TaxID=2854030 RepID=UPI001CD52BC5|nr:PBP1A family penicillin-binding protein [Cognatishimia sp. MH4019]
MSTRRPGKPPLVAEKRYKPKPPAQKRKRKPAAKPRRKASRIPGLGLVTSFLRWIWRILFGLGWRLTFVVALLVGSGVLYFYATLPDATELVDGRARGSVTMLDRNGEVYAWRGDQFGGMVTADSVSKHLKNAVVATEDKRFYRHLGVSPRGVASAVRINLREGRGPLSGHGGSTITQQTAKLLCLGEPYIPTEWDSEAAYEADCRRGTLWRKIKEATFALAMEAKYSKDEILTIYLNRAFLGAGSRGFEAASQRYFGKSAAEVAPSEAAMLAGLLIAPSRFAPTNSLERAQNRANVIVGLMEDQGYLSASAAEFARQNPAQLSQAASARAGGYFADWVMQSGPEFFTRNTTEDVIIRTTLDQRIQTAAEEALKEVFETQVREGSKAEAAIVVMSADGAVRGMVGGRQTKVSGAFNRATQARRQTGSAFKPFVYATALELGYSFNDLVEDTPLTMNIPGSGPWTPKNYTNDFKGTVTLTRALAESLNIPAVRVSEGVGRDLVEKVAADFGIKSEIAVGPAIALGTSEATLVEMTGAYAGILNGGSSVTPYGLVSLRLQGDNSDLMDNPGGIGERVIREDAARQLTYMMSKVITEGTGRRAALSGREAAGKSGTTQAARDAWFIGFTADYVVGVWMGYDDNTPLTGVTGGGLPAEIWRQTMERVHQGVAPKPLPMIRPAQQAVRQPSVQNTRAGQPRRQQPASLEEGILNILNGLLGGNR